MKYYIGPKFEKMTQIPSHDLYIRNVLMARLILKDPKINVKEVKSNVSSIYTARRARIQTICDKEYSKNNLLLKDSNKLHG